MPKKTQRSETSLSVSSFVAIDVRSTVASPRAPRASSRKFGHVEFADASAVAAASAALKLFMIQLAIPVVPVARVVRSLCGFKLLRPENQPVSLSICSFQIECTIKIQRFNSPRQRIRDRFDPSLRSAHENQQKTCTRKAIHLMDEWKSAVVQIDAIAAGARRRPGGVERAREK